MRQKQHGNEATSNKYLTSLVPQIPSSAIEDRRIFNGTAVEGLPSLQCTYVLIDGSVDEIRVNMHFLYLSEIDFLSNI